MSDNSAQNGTDTIRDLARQAGAVKTQVAQLDIGGASANAEILVTAGQQVMAASLPVVMASDQPHLPMGTDITTPTAMPAGGVGIRGWLSAIWTKLNGTIDIGDRAGRLLGVIASITGALPTGTNHLGSVNIDSSQGSVAAVSQAITATVADAQGTPTTASGAGQAIANVAASGNVTFHLLAAAFVGTVVFEASLNGGSNYAPLLCIREDGTGAEASTAINTAVALIRSYTAGIPGFTHFRVRCSAFTSGSLAVYITQGPFLLEPNPSLAASSAVVGKVGIDQTTPGSTNLVANTPSTLVVTTLSTAATAVTATLPAAGAGLFHYITRIEIVRVATAAVTGSAVLGYTSTNLPGSWARSAGNAIAIGATVKDVDEALASPLKSSAANTATTIVAPSGGTGVQVRITVYYYTGA